MKNGITYIATGLLSMAVTILNMFCCVEQCQPSSNGYGEYSIYMDGHYHRGSCMDYYKKINAVGGLLLKSHSYLSSW